MEMDGGTQQLEMILGNYQNQAIATMQDFFEKSTGRIVQIDGLVNKEAEELAGVVRQRVATAKEQKQEALCCVESFKETLNYAIDEQTEA